MTARVSTYSIIARHKKTGQFGIGVQSHWFAVGSLTPWIERGVGAVVIQAQVDAIYGSLGLDMMRAGKSAEQTVAAMVAADPRSAERQVAMIDKRGQVVAHTGENCVAYAGHIIDDQFGVQGNLLKGKEVLEAMADAYKKAVADDIGDFSERLLRALEAGQDAGGDVRGRQSASLLVVPGSDDPVDRRMITDLRVDDSKHPLIDLRRLLTVQRGYEWYAQATYAVEVGNLDEAKKCYANLRGLAVGTREPQFWYATILAKHGHLDEALPVFEEVFQVEPFWLGLIDRLVDAGSFPSDKEIIAKIKAKAKAEGKQ